ncbi:DUF3300 domain-containing protein [Carboxylicivirga sp. A043]|uniref:DUF3300 domain-containing protein n=1 Tax=Carboxylicivirga litoralis TaxID=2816963 RepID=UPI0021CAF6D1|nr:DUF3300 domain-containing protein [Carboxylicivirga sp. A043]MCU4156033.1 DUF3300 domain-containing protein [Carboxylicivirga sp. A043]
MRVINRCKVISTRFLFVLILQVVVVSSMAQTDLIKLKQVIEEDSTLLNGLAGYDAPVRNDILIVAQHPEVLNRLKDQQEAAQQSFQNIIGDYDRDTQFGIYELSRYPDLIKELTIQGKLKKKEIENIILSYPEDIHEAALKYGRKCYKALASIEHLNEKNQKGFDDLISKYDTDFQASIKRLIDTPEVLSTMAENIEFTRLAGSVYKQYPEDVDAKLEVLHNQIKAQKEQELADYQEELKEDPEAYQEMLNAAEQFAAEEMSNKSITDPVTKEVEVVHVNHYSYWYGYPYWYSYPYWRPYPWYYHTGFYYGPRGVVFIGMPSYWYVGWHHRYYPNRYPHLTYHYYRHSYRHPHSYYNFNRTVNVNIKNNMNIDRSNLARIDNNRGKIIPRQWPSQRPVARPDARPSARPEARPATRPSTRPTQPTQRPSTRPSTRPTQPTTKPSTGPATRPSTPTTRPATRPAPRTNYNNYRSNESFRQSWSRPSTPAARPAARPSGGFRRR